MDEGNRICGTSYSELLQSMARRDYLLFSKPWELPVGVCRVLEQERPLIQGFRSTQHYQHSLLS